MGLKPTSTDWNLDMFADTDHIKPVAPFVDPRSSIDSLDSGHMSEPSKNAQNNDSATGHQKDQTKDRNDAGKTNDQRLLSGKLSKTVAQQLHAKRNSSR